MTVTDVELAGMRATLNASLPDTVQVSRATRTPDGGGGQSQVWATIATVPCRLTDQSPAPPQEIDIGARPGSIIRWTITMPAETDVLVTDRLLVGSRTFEVRGVDRARTWAIAVIAHCSEVL